jgi:dienelactone hydrolase
MLTTAPAAGAPTPLSREDVDPTQATISPCLATPCEPLPELGWEGRHRAQRVEFRSSRTGARLRGTVLAPPHGAHGRHPAVVIVPGSLWGAREEQYHWSARELASHGYVVLGVDPQGTGRSGAAGDPACEPATTLDDPEYPYPCRGIPFQQKENFNDAAISGLDFILSDENPFGRLVNAEALGVAGHSLGAGAAATAQSRDSRVKAVVAWDNLTGDEYGAEENGPLHHAINAHVPTQTDLYLHEFRAPALGLASEIESETFYDRDPDKRKRGYAHWRDAGLPTMEVVFRGVEHGDFVQPDDTEPGGEHDLKLRRFQWYTRAWFDLHLKGDESAIGTLLAQNVFGMTRDEMLSVNWRSAAFLPAAGVDCEDLRHCG